MAYMDTTLLNQEGSSLQQPVHYSNTTEDMLETWQILLIVLATLLIVALVVALAFFLYKKFSRKPIVKEEFTQRMSKYYDSIAIDDKFTGINYDLFQNQSSDNSTNSTRISTPVTPKSNNITTGAHNEHSTAEYQNHASAPHQAERAKSSIYIQRVDYPSYKISNGKLPSMHLHSNFSLEGTLQTLKELDLDHDNISEIRKSYQYYGDLDGEDSDVDVRDDDIEDEWVEDEGGLIRQATDVKELHLTVSKLEQAQINRIHNVSNSAKRKISSDIEKNIAGLKSLSPNTNNDVKGISVDQSTHL